MSGVVKLASVQKRKRAAFVAMIVIAFCVPYLVLKIDWSSATAGDAPFTTSTFVGRATVVDGDTLTVEGQPKNVRLFGLDAPESSQVCTDAAGARFLCGGRAAATLAELIGRNGRVDCVQRDRDRYGRSVAICSIDGRDLGDAMVRRGWAIDYPKYSRGRHEAAEEEARDAKRGLWAGDFEAPWEWRAKRRDIGRR